jgi:hypothetical protein
MVAVDMFGWVGLNSLTDTETVKIGDNDIGM